MTMPLSKMLCAIAIMISSATIACADAPNTGASQTNPPVDNGKRYACAADVTARKLRGTDRLDAMEICMAEGRLDCVKKAVAQKVPPSGRKVFLQGCMLGPAARNDETQPPQ